MSGHALIVGGSSGIGRATAERLSATMAVTALARRLDRLQELEPKGVHAVQCDIADSAAIAGAVEAAVAAQGKISAMVVAAGVQKIKPARMMKAADLRELIAVNLEAPLVLAGLFASKRITTDDAVFCAVSSIAASRPEPGILAYSASKAGLEAMVKALAREAAPRRAVAVSPGWLDTEMTRAHSAIYNEDFKGKLEQSAPLGIATVDAVVDAIEFLISPAARFITGEIVRVDGGAAL